MWPLPNGATNTAYDVNDRIVGHTYDLDGNETTVNGQTAVKGQTANCDFDTK